MGIAPVLALRSLATMGIPRPHTAPACSMAISPERRPLVPAMTITLPDSYAIMQLERLHKPSSAGPSRSERRYSPT